MSETDFTINPIFVSLGMDINDTRPFTGSSLGLRFILNYRIAQMSDRFLFSSKRFLQITEPVIAELIIEPTLVRLALGGDYLAGIPGPHAGRILLPLVSDMIGLRSPESQVDATFTERCPQELQSAIKGLLI
jgi:hypothetical protein